MKRTAYSGLLLLALALLAGCKDDPAGPNNPGTGSNDYQPLSKGSTWTYTGRENYTLTILGDTTANGTTWTIAKNSTLPQPGYMRKSGSTYTSCDTLGGQVYTYLKEDGVGATWSFERMGPNFTPNKQEFSVAETGLTKTVNSREYTNVIRVHLVTSVYVSLTDQWMQATTSDLYFAKGVGFIQGDYGVLGTVSLVSYEIK